MITDNDVNKIKKKLEGSFVTKNEFKKLVNTVATKEDIKTLSEDIRTVINMVGESLSQNKEQDDILNNHEKRLDRVEDKVFSTY